VKFESIVSMVGNTPAVRIAGGDAGNCSIWVKLEGFNPTNSVKDRACLSIIRDARETGRLKPGMTLLDASSGNMACALAFYGRIFHHPVHVVCSSKLTADKANFIRYFGADMELVGDFTIEGNRYCAEVLRARDPGRYCFLDQLHNWANPRASYNTLGPEILADFPQAAAVVGSLGSGGSLLGTAMYVKERRPDITVLAVESAVGTKIPGTGSFEDGDYVTPFIRKGREERLFDRSFKVSLDEARRSTDILANQGVFVGLQTGGVVCAALSLAQSGTISGDIVAISGDSGWKNMEKLLSP
jgi:[CysO sulfur-carrier protein]-thiocarboxylate-dependent cysteine synthase